MRSSGWHTDACEGSGIVASVMGCGNPRTEECHKVVVGLALLHACLASVFPAIGSMYSGSAADLRRNVFAESSLALERNGHLVAALDIEANLGVTAVRSDLGETKVVGSVVVVMLAVDEKAPMLPSEHLRNILLLP